MNIRGHRLNDNTPGKAYPRHQENVLIMDLSLDRAAAWIEAVDWNLIDNLIEPIFLHKTGQNEPRGP